MARLAFWVAVEDRGYRTRVAISADLAERLETGDRSALYSLSVRASKSRGNREFGHNYHPDSLNVTLLGPYRRSKPKSQSASSRPAIVAVYGVCQDCGYDCRDQVGTDRCPNCGEKITWPDDL